MAEEACRLYQKRFRIETFFSDQKSRGFHIHKSHLSDVQRLSRLLIAACLAYIWVVYLGALCEKEQWRAIIHRTQRCDLSLFQLGLRFLEYLLNEELPIPVQSLGVRFPDACFVFSSPNAQVFGPGLIPRSLLRGDLH